MAPNDGVIMIEDAKVVFRNFAGKEGMYNREGDRNFSVIIDSEFAQKLIADGWNPKQLKVREEGVEPDWHLPISVGFKIRPPRMVLIGERSKKRTVLDEDTCEIMDWVDIVTVDLSIRPYSWTVRDASGVKAYLQTIYVTIAEDPVELKYSTPEDLPSESGQVKDDD